MVISILYLIRYKNRNYHIERYFFNAYFFKIRKDTFSLHMHMFGITILVRQVHITIDFADAVKMLKNYMHARVSLSLWHLYSKQLRTSLCAYRIYLFLMLFVKDKYYTQTSIQRTSDIHQTSFVHYIPNLLYLDFVNSTGSWHLFTKSQNSLYWDSLYRSLGVYIYIFIKISKFI